MGIHPIHRKPIRCQELQRAIALDCLQWAHPGIEMLARQLVLERAHAAGPEPASYRHRIACRCSQDGELRRRWVAKKGSESSRSQNLSAGELLTPVTPAA